MMLSIFYLLRAACWSLVVGSNGGGGWGARVEVERLLSGYLDAYYCNSYSISIMSHYDLLIITLMILHKIYLLFTALIAALLQLF
jgi:hypothetical protein